MDNTDKFSGRAADYTKGRPGYPDELFDYLYDEFGFSHESVIADIGSGTGKFSKYMLDRGSVVYLVEPNADMRAVAKSELSDYKKGIIIDGTSDNTGLADHSVDFITAAQAFHWFDAQLFKNECKRILKPNGKVVLVWNTRDMSSAFNVQSYDIYKRFCPSFQGYHDGMKDDDECIEAFFNHNFVKFVFKNPVLFTKEKFIKRSLSASYSLQRDDKGFSLYIQELENLFDEYSRNGIVEMKNNTVVYSGDLI